MNYHRTLRLVVTVISAILLGIVGPTGATTQWDLAADFSSTINPNLPWLYGTSPDLAPSYVVTKYNYPNADLAPLQAWTDGNPSFTNPSLFYNPTNVPVDISTLTVPAKQVAVHPGSSGQVSHAVWIAPATNTYVINATFTGYDHAGTTTDVYVLFNGVSQFSGSVNGYGPPSQVSYTSPQWLILAGQTVDFAVGFGSDGNYNSDTTGIAAKINAVPAPATLMLLGSGLIGLVGWRRFRKS